MRTRARTRRHGGTVVRLVGGCGVRSRHWHSVCLLLFPMRCVQRRMYRHERILGCDRGEGATG